MARWGWAAAIVVMGYALPARGADVSRAEIEAAIERGVKLIVSQQAEGGNWAYISRKGAENHQFKVGHAALMVLALQHSGSKSAEAQLAIKKGLSYILQTPPEPETYGAGLIEQVLYGDNASQHGPVMTAYTWMLINGQIPAGPTGGSWSYPLVPPPNNWRTNGFQAVAPKPDWTRGDNSCTQFGILGLVYAEKAGYQVPRIVWERTLDYYARVQHEDGGWDYMQKAGPPYMSMTLAGTVSTYLCDEMLADKSHRQCVTRAPNKTHEAGLKNIVEHWKGAGNGGYPWYAAERLGMLIGYSEFGGHDWYQEGANFLAPKVGQEFDIQFTHGTLIENAFMVLFLSRGRHPIIINKLKRQGDWNLHRYDIKNLTEHISGPWQIPCQWRIVTLDAKADFLLKTPILWISGHEALKFTAEEKAKLKDYVERGGTILAEDCCSKKAFDESFRAMLKELWPENDLAALPKTHAIYTSFRKLENPPSLMAMALEKGQGRLGAIYIPNGISCRWEGGGAGARPWLDAGACIYLYVDKMGKRLKAEAAEAPAAKTETPAVKTEN